MYCITSVSMVEKSLQGSEPAGKPHRRPCCAGKPRDDVDGTRLFHAFLASRKWRCSPAMQDESDESEMMPWHPWDLITLRSSMLPLHWQKLTGYWSPVELAWAQILAWTPTKVCAIRVLTMISFVELSCCMTSQHCFTAFGWAAFWNIGALRRMKAFRSWRICCEKEPIWVECIFTLATWMVTWDTGALHPAVLCLLIHFFPRCHPPPKKKHWDPQSLHVCLPTEDSCRVFLCVKFMAAAKTGCVRHIWHRLLLKASVNAGSQCVKSSANSWMDETPVPPAVLRRHSNFHRMRAWTCWSAVVVFHSDQPFRCLGMKTKPFLTFCDKHGKPIRGGKTGWNESWKLVVD